MIFVWHRANVEHIAKHGVTPGEAEEVVNAARPPWPRNRPDGKHLVWGRTKAGRYLQVIFVMPAEEDVDVESMTLPDLIDWAEGGQAAVLVIHARDLEDAEKKQFRKRSRTR